ncbi:MAG: ribonuclease HI [Clostridia bacterium]|nr:ribonuclease HI [Clostridia bacterium]
MPLVDIYTDGACSGNPGPGGYGAILVYNGHEKELSGGELNTTNNRMELLAVIVALENLKYPCRVNVTTDSKYVSDAINKKWLDSWIKQGWKRGKNKEIANVDLWKKLAHLLSIHQVKFHWIKGHDGHEYNERCDKLAKNYYLKLSD